jgi:hypothetical protein
MNPQCFSGTKQQGAQKWMMCCGLWNAIGLFLFNDAVNEESLTRSRLEPGGKKQNRSCKMILRHSSSLAKKTLPGRWIDRREEVELAPRLSDLNPLTIFWGYVRSQVFTLKLTIGPIVLLKHRNKQVCKFTNTNMLRIIQGNIFFLYNHAIRKAVNMLHPIRETAHFMNLPLLLLTS